MTCFRVFISASVLFFALIIGLIVYENKYMNVDTIREGVKARIFATMLANMQAKLGVLVRCSSFIIFLHFLIFSQAGTTKTSFI